MSEKIKSYKDLLVWQKSIKLTTRIYALTKQFPKDEMYGLSAQLRRAAVSVPSNIAEGHARQHNKEFKQFLHIALGSVAEVDTQLCIARELRYINEDTYLGVYEGLIEIQKMTWGLIRSLEHE